MINRYIITGDIHLNLSKNEEFERQRFLEFIDTINQEDGIIVFAGDLFDKAKPTLQEIDLFYQAVETLSFNHQVIIIDGNHEKVDINTTTFDYLPKYNFTYYTKPTPIKINQKNTLWLLGHSNLDKLKEIELRDGSNILISHFRCSLGIIKQEVDVNYISKTFDYCIAGDIHQHYKPFENVEYTSQPYNTHYDIKKDNGYIVLTFDIKGYKIEYKQINLANKYKLELTAKEYKDLFSSLDDNLYKIVIKDIADNVKNLPQRDNIILTYKPDVIVSDNDIEELKAEIKQSGNIDVVSTLKRLVRNSEELSESTLRKGEEIIEYIMKGYL